MSTSNILGSIVGAGAILSLLNKTGATKVTTDLLQSGSIVTAAGGILSASSTISDSLSGVAAGIESSITSVETSISSTISSLETSIANTVDNAANTVSNSLTSISNTVSNAINAISNFSISSTISSIENFSVTDTITALQNSAKTWASSTVPGVSASGIPAIPAYSATPQNMQNYTMNRNFALPSTLAIAGNASTATGETTGVNTTVTKCTPTVSSDLKVDPNQHIVPTDDSQYITPSSCIPMSDTLKSLIIKEELISYVTYSDVSQTDIGYGFKITDPIVVKYMPKMQALSSSSDKLDLRNNQDAARLIFDSILSEYCARIHGKIVARLVDQNSIPIKITQNMHDAISDLAYNAGEGIISSSNSDLMKLLLRKNYQMAGDLIARVPGTDHAYYNANKNCAVETRRQTERGLFCK